MVARKVWKMLMMREKVESIINDLFSDREQETIFTNNHFVLNVFFFTAQ